MRKFCALLLLFAYLSVPAAIISYNQDIEPSFSKMKSFFKSNGGLDKLLKVHLMIIPKDMEINFFAQLQIAKAYISVELYTVQFYGLTQEYQNYLLSESFNKAVEQIEAKEKSNGGRPDFLFEIHKTFETAMAKESPRLAKIYSSSRYQEAHLSMVRDVFGNSEEIKNPEKEVSDLMLFKEIVTRRLQESLEGFYPLKAEATFSEIATDLRSYYRCSNCPDDIAEIFVDYLSALDSFAIVLQNSPKDIAPDEALALVLLWTAAGGDPLDPARIDMQNKQNWNMQMQNAIDNLTEKENKLNKACIKYGLRL